MGTRLTIQTPGDYRFLRDVCSYGYFLLAPNVWDPDDRTLTRPLNLDGGVATLTIAQPDNRKGSPLKIAADRALTRSERGEAKRQVTRMLRLDDESVADFHRTDPRWRKSGKGRLFRSPTPFEDIIKTVTSCNVTWPSTVNMNKRLCEVVCPAFPTPGQMSRKRPATLRARCGVGYRDQRMVDLARLAVRGELDLDRLEDPAISDDDIGATLLSLPGIGPYAAANIMMLLGRYSRLAIDTETIRHGKAVLGHTGSDASIRKKLEAHYAPFGEHKFRSYWFEVWDFYESRQGPAHTWAPRAVANAFTASNLNK
jgi:3-methyladenine DNA glycosylase/8-oxoguanine DNA glycosylase